MITHLALLQPSYIHISKLLNLPPQKIQTYTFGFLYLFKMYNNKLMTQLHLKTQILLLQSLNLIILRMGKTSSSSSTIIITTTTLIRISIFVILLTISKSDPDPLQDYCVASTATPQSFFINGSPCINPSLATASHFKTSALSKPGDTTTNTFGFSITLTNIQNMPGVNTQGLTMGRVDIAVDGIVPLHWHPRASEIVHLLQGFLLVGFVDTSNRVFTQQLRPGDSFVFPKGLPHFLYNLDQSSPALVLAGLNSQNPGVEVASLLRFTSKSPILDQVLSRQSRFTDQDVQLIRKNLGG